MVRTIFLCVCVITLVIIYPGFAIPIQFPPEPGPYAGDYVLIQEPGKYTLEHNISHTYPVGVIITSSSVILDGQGYHISPSSTGGPSVGIWVTGLDTSQKPVTGVRVQNLTITDEVTGIYLEGTDSSEFPWGSDHSPDSKAVLAIQSDREIKCSDVAISGCRMGIASYDLESPVLWESTVRGNNQGLFVSGGTPDIRDMVISGNSGAGVSLHNTSGGEITRSRIEGNSGGGILLDHVSGTLIWDNILDNAINIKDTESVGVRLYHDLMNQTNIIKGALTGGNLWAEGGVPVYISQMIPDADQNGIGDIPYTKSGLEDRYPLIPSGAGFSPQPVPVQSAVPTNAPAPVSTPLSIITGMHAVITGDTIPAEMKAGMTYPVSITLLNDGTDDWLLLHAVGIRASDSAASYGPEWLEIPSLVSSKQPYTFQFEIKAPSERGRYDFTYQATRGGQGVSVTFGRPHKKVVTVQ